jgi:hypothetical protein
MSGSTTCITALTFLLADHLAPSFQSLLPYGPPPEESGIQARDQECKSTSKSDPQETANLLPRGIMEKLDSQNKTLAQVVERQVVERRFDAQFKDLTVHAAPLATKKDVEESSAQLRKEVNAMVQGAQQLAADEEEEEETTPQTRRHSL